MSLFILGSEPYIKWQKVLFPQPVVPIRHKTGSLLPGFLMVSYYSFSYYFPGSTFDVIYSYLLSSLIWLYYLFYLNSFNSCKFSFLLPLWWTLFYTFLSDIFTKSSTPEIISEFKKCEGSIDVYGIDSSDATVATTLDADFLIWSNSRASLNISVIS